ncbi:hypothetical protein BH10PSE12_BH10PSE12_25070 [soil metagenome]
MTFAIDQCVKLAEANGQFLLDLAEIARENGKEYIRIAGKRAAAFVAQIEAVTADVSPRVDSKASTTLLAEIEKRHDAAVEKFKIALDEWRESWSDMWRPWAIRNRR